MSTEQEKNKEISLIFHLVERTAILAKEDNLPDMLQTGEKFPFAMPLVSIVDSVLDCFVFSCAWIICMYYREALENDSDIDF